MIYRTAPFSMTLNNPTPVSRSRRPFFDAEYLKEAVCFILFLFIYEHLLKY